MTAAPAWSRVLDEFGRRLEIQEALVAVGHYADIEEFQPPADLGPLPAELELAARRLLHRAQALETAVEQDIDASRRRARMLRRLQNAAPRAPMFTEQRA
jgi:hypothetical protein